MGLSGARGCDYSQSMTFPRLTYIPDDPMVKAEFGPMEDWARSDWPSHPLLMVDRRADGTILALILAGTPARRAAEAGLDVALRELCDRGSEGIVTEGDVGWTNADIDAHLAEFRVWVDAHEDLLGAPVERRE